MNPLPPQKKKKKTRQDNVSYKQEKNEGLGMSDCKSTHKFKMRSAIELATRSMMKISQLIIYRIVDDAEVARIDTHSNLAMPIYRKAGRIYMRKRDDRENEG
jgi:hypothetical protein